METEGRRKIDEFAEESRILENARLTLTKIDLTADQWRQHYEQLVEAYANLLESARVLTRNSDRLQRKLDEANRKLEMQNKLLEKEAEEALLKSESVLQLNKRLAEEKMQLDTRINRVQMALIVMVAVLTVVILFMLYYLIFDPERANTSHARNQKVSFSQWRALYVGAWAPTFSPIGFCQGSFLHGEPDGGGWRFWGASSGKSG
jgi:hypothetical protein